ncbi:hypothetical protein PoB_002802300, partial [Plakobranchus ocellatus]
MRRFNRQLEVGGKEKDRPVSSKIRHKSRAQKLVSFVDETSQEVSIHKKTSQSVAILVTTVKLICEKIKAIEHSKFIATDKKSKSGFYILFQSML